jgi:hypothetical protein
MKIEFIPTDKETELIVPPPVTSKSAIPDWYSSKKRFVGSGAPSIHNGGVDNNSIKACYPFYDSMTFGYVQKTWCDIYIEFFDDFARYEFSTGPEIISLRERVAIKISEDYWPFEFVWKMRWSVKTPPGWSCMLVSPLNRPDLPFESLSGVIDSDEFTHPDVGDYPFYVKKSFNNFIIPAGTPMFQMFPVKRDNWQSSNLNLDTEKILKNKWKLKKHFIGGYKKVFYKPKKFE